MGNDGGSIPTRRELVKEAARDPSTTEVKETQNEQQQYYWTTCPLSHQPLRAPIVSDSAGLLYSKDAVLEHLLESVVGQDGAELGNDEGFKTRVKGLRDLVEVKFQLEETESKQTGMVSTLKWVCPITKKTLGPRIKAVYIVPCGHAFLESAIKEMPGENCLQCNESYALENVIAILPFSAADKERLKNRAQRLKEQGLTHSLKKAPGSSRKRKKNITMAEAPISDGIQDESNSTTQADKANPAPHSSINNEGTAALTAKVLAEQEDRNKRRKTGTNGNLKSLFSSKNRNAEKHIDFMTRGFSIPADAKR